MGEGEGEGEMESERGRERMSIIEEQTQTFNEIISF